QAKFSKTPEEVQTLRRGIIKQQNVPVDRAALEYQRMQDHFLAMVLMNLNLRELLKDCHEVFFSEGEPRDLFNYLKQHPKSTPDDMIAPKTPAVPAKKASDLGWRISPDYVKIISVQYEELY